MLEVLHAGLYASVQDLGRTGLGSLGVPLAGVMDTYSAKLANLLLQNEEGAAMMEITFGGCKLRFQESTVVAITGADFSATINDRRVALNRVIPIKAGSVLDFGRRQFGCRTYLAVKGGFLTPEVLGSRSFYQGITSDFMIRKGDGLPYASHPNLHSAPHALVKVRPNHFAAPTLSCFEGPEFDGLSASQQQQLLGSTFTLSKDSNRMGIRLSEAIENKLPSMLTSAVLPGTVQLTPSGTLIILMRDGQVTGGYPRILQLTEAAISHLAQKGSGEEVGFKMV